MSVRVGPVRGLLALAMCASERQPRLRVNSWPCGLVTGLATPERARCRIHECPKVHVGWTLDVDLHKARVDAEAQRLLSAQVQTAS